MNEDWLIFDAMLAAFVGGPKPKNLTFREEIIWEIVWIDAKWNVNKGEVA